MTSLRQAVGVGAAPGLSFGQAIGVATEPIRKALEPIIALKMSAGMARHEAFAAACRERPDLRTGLVEATNRIARLGEHFSRPRETLRPYRQAFEGLVALKEALGFRQHEACAAVCRENPQLRRLMVQEFNDAATV